MAIQTIIEDLTPPKAHYYLSMNMRNRRVSNQHVDRLAEDIDKDRWEINGDALKFDTTPQMIDGQHRCLAVIKAQKSIKTLVITGLDPNARNVIDLGGKPRSVADVLRLNDIANGSQKAATASAYLFYRDRKDQLWSPLSRPSRATIADFVQRNDSIFQEAHIFGEAVKRATGLSITVTSAAFIAYGHNDYWTDFMHGFCDGVGLRVGDPRLTLRNTLLTALNSRREVDRTQTQRNMALLLRSLDAFITGHDLRMLKWTRLNLPMLTLEGERVLS